VPRIAQLHRYTVLYDNIRIAMVAVVAGDWPLRDVEIPERTRADQTKPPWRCQAGDLTICKAVNSFKAVEVAIVPFPPPPQPTPTPREAVNS
jgi:hypothetical protein